MRINAFGHSDVGLKRRHNEDSWVIDEDIRLYIVADGMGGHQAGEVASQLTTGKIPSLLRKFEIEDTENIPVILEEIINHVHHEVSNEAHIDPNKKGMGTTLCLLLLRGNTFWSTNIGDSPIYLYRDRELIKITKDQTFVQEQLDRGMISLQEAKGHRYKNVLTQSIGSKKILKIPIISGQLNSNDMFLLCSDGLSNPLEADDIINILSDNLQIDQKVKKLIERAKAIDGSDNITSVLVHVVETDDEESLISDDTIKFENVYAGENRGENEGSESESAAASSFEAEKDADISESFYELEDSKPKKALKWILSIFTILLIAVLIYLFKYLNLLQSNEKAKQPVISQTSQPGPDGEATADVPENNITGDDRPTIRTEEDMDQVDENISDLPIVEDKDQYIDLDIIDKPFPDDENIHRETPVDLPEADHFMELKNSFINNVYPDRNIDLLNHLCIRFAQYIRQFPDKFTVRKGAFQKPEMSIFQEAFLDIVKNSGDFFLVMKDSDGTRTYILYLGLYDTFEEASDQSKEGKVYTVREIFEREPLISN